MRCQLERKSRQKTNKEVNTEKMSVNHLILLFCSLITDSKTSLPSSSSSFSFHFVLSLSFSSPYFSSTLFSPTSPPPTSLPLFLSILWYILPLLCLTESYISHTTDLESPRQKKISTNFPVSMAQHKTLSSSFPFL